MIELKLEVGKTYLDRLDNEVLITAISIHAYFPMQSASDSYMLNGRLFALAVDNVGDLISECFEPTQPALDKKANEKDAVIVQLQGMVVAWKTEAEYQYGQLRLQLYPGETDYPVWGALDAYARGKYAALRDDNAQPSNNPTGETK